MNHHSVFICFLKDKRDGARRVSRGRELHRRGAATEKALLLVPPDLASFIEGPFSRARLAECSLRRATGGGCGHATIQASNHIEL